MFTLIQDCRYAIRQLWNAPGFTITAWLTLAIGIGANTAIFTLVHGVLLKSLPVSNPEPLYWLGDEYSCCVEGGFQDDWSIFSYPFYEQVRVHTTIFDEVAAMQAGRPDLSVRRNGSATRAESFRGEFVSGNYFSTLGVGAFAGRMLRPADDLPGATPAAVVSYRAWQHQYGGDPAIVGASLTVNGTPVTVVGVSPQRSSAIGWRATRPPSGCRWRSNLRSRERILCSTHRPRPGFTSLDGCGLAFNQVTSRPGSRPSCSNTCRLQETEIRTRT